ncbi:MAG TPA: SPW repeat protein [Egibacteraceae bacterium]|nr:SPW repeat protein [Egibacteraceae bacterium]
MTKGWIPQAAASLAGVWLMAAPAVLGHSGTAAADSDRLVGPLIAAVGFVAASEITRSLRWLNLPAAVWLIVAPWVLGFPLAAAVSNLMAGAALLALTPLGPPDPTRFGGGWSSLWDEQRLAGGYGVPPPIDEDR